MLKWLFLTNALATLLVATLLLFSFSPSITFHTLHLLLCLQCSRRQWVSPAVWFSVCHDLSLPCIPCLVSLISFWIKPGGSRPKTVSLTCLANIKLVCDLYWCPPRYILDYRLHLISWILLWDAVGALQISKKCFLPFYHCSCIVARNT